MVSKVWDISVVPKRKQIAVNYVDGGDNNSGWIITVYTDELIAEMASWSWRRPF